MSKQLAALNALREMIDAVAGALAPVYVGALPAENGLCMAVSTGRTEALALDGGTLNTLDVALTCKHTDQVTALDMLGIVCEALAKASPLPDGDGWQMTAVRVSAAAGYVDRDGTRWLYGAALAVEYAADES